MYRTTKKTNNFLGDWLSSGAATLAVGMNGVAKYYGKAESGYKVRHIDANSIGQQTLQRGYQGASQDGHDEDACCYLGVVGMIACGNATKGYAVDGGEHQTHKETDEDK